MTNEFMREEHYIVFKISDLGNSIKGDEIRRLAREYAEQRRLKGKKPLECVVVEKDWPEYESTWKAIEARVTGAQPAPSTEYVGWYCAHCERGVDASEVTYHEQHQVCGRIITDDKPPKPASSVPDDVLKDAERYRFLEYLCATGTYGGIISRKAIDAAMLAAAPEAKP